MKKEVALITCFPDIPASGLEDNGASWCSGNTVACHAIVESSILSEAVSLDKKRRTNGW